MKSISPALQTHLAGELTTLATCVLLTRIDGTVFAFTDHDQPLTIGGRVYTPELSFSRTAVRSSADGSVDNLEAQGVLDSTQITDADIQAGKFDGADVRIFIVNWADLTMGTLKLRRGTMGKVTLGQNQYRTEVRGLMQLLQSTVGEVYQPTCRADLGDARCTVNLDALAVTDVVASVSSQSLFVATALAQAGPVIKSYTASTISFGKAANPLLPNRSIKDSANGFVAAGFVVGDVISVSGTYRNDRPLRIKTIAAGAITVDPTTTPVYNERAGKPTTLKAVTLGYFDLGYLEWLSGANAGIKQEVRAWSGPSTKQVTLFMAAPFPIAPGDSYKIRPGCDKRLPTCINKFNNVLNFRGESTVPGQDALMVYPNASGAVP